MNRIQFYLLFFKFAFVYSIAFPSLEPLSFEKNWRLTAHATELFGRFDFDSTTDPAVDVGSNKSAGVVDWGDKQWSLHLESTSYLLSDAALATTPVRCTAPAGCLDCSDVTVETAPYLRTVGLPSVDFANLPSFSINLWVFVNADEATQQRIISRATSDSASAADFQLTFFPPLYDPRARDHVLALDSLRLRLRGKTYFGTMFLPVRQWIMFTITHGPVFVQPGTMRNHVRLYADGIKVIDVVETLNSLSGVRTQTGLCSSRVEIRGNSVFGPPLSGYIDDFRVWSRVLDLADIALLRVGIESITLPCVSGLDQLISTADQLSDILDDRFRNSFLQSATPVIADDSDQWSNEAAGKYTFADFLANGYTGTILHSFAIKSAPTTVVVEFSGIGAQGVDFPHCGLNGAAWLSGAAVDIDRYVGTGYAHCYFHIYTVTANRFLNIGLSEGLKDWLPDPVEVRVYLIEELHPVDTAYFSEQIVTPWFAALQALKNRCAADFGQTTPEIVATTAPPSAKPTTIATPTTVDGETIVARTTTERTERPTAERPTAERTTIIDDTFSTTVWARSTQSTVLATINHSSREASYPLFYGLIIGGSVLVFLLVLGLLIGCVLRNKKTSNQQPDVKMSETVVKPNDDYGVLPLNEMHVYGESSLNNDTV